MDRQQPQQVTTWSDTEIGSIAEDRLGRAQFSSKVAALIGNTPLGCRSTVYGIVGPWGGGKSSILNLVRAEIVKQPDPLAVVEFNPWAMSDSTGLLIEFFDTLIGAHESLRSTGIKQSLTAFLSKCAPALSPIPVVGQAASKTIENFLGGRNWAQEFARVDEIIFATKTRILVVVDDVDRLDGEELKTLIKAIRMLGRFRNVHYLMAYDQDALIDVMKSSMANDPERARAFLEKIVQYPLVIPPAQGDHLKQILDEELGRTLNATGENWVAIQDLGFFLALFNDLLHRKLSTVRSVLRYCVQVDLYYRLLQDEVEAADFLILTYIRVYYPSVYSQLPQWKWELTGEPGTEEISVLDDKSWDIRMDEAGLVRPGDRKDVIRLMKYLFPETEERDRGLLRMRSPEYFDRYLVFGIPEGDIANQKLVDDLNDAASKDWSELRVEDFNHSFTSQSLATRATAIAKAVDVVDMEPGDVHGVLNFFVWLINQDLPTVFLGMRENQARWLARLILNYPASADMSVLKETLLRMPHATLLCEGLVQADLLMQAAIQGANDPEGNFAGREQVAEAIATLAARQIQVLTKSVDLASAGYEFRSLFHLLKGFSLLERTKAYLDAWAFRGTLDVVALAALFIERINVGDYLSDARRSLRSEEFPMSDLYSLIGLPLLRNTKVESSDLEELMADDEDSVRRRKIAAKAILGWQTALNEP